MKLIGKSLFSCIFLQHFLLVYDTVAVTTLLIITGLCRIFFALIKYYFVIFIVSGTIVFKLHNIIRRIQSIQKSIRRAVFPFHWDTDKRRVDILPTFQY